MPVTTPCPEQVETSIFCQDVQEAQPRSRLKFWEIDQLFICPVIGMCLSASEQRQLLKKTDLAVKKASPFELHEALVASSKEESPLSRRVDSLLDRKFGAEAEQFRELDHQSLAARCKLACDEGNPAPVLWAAAISPGLPPGLKREIFGTVHMTMHFHSEQFLAMRQKLGRQDKMLEQQRLSLKDAGRDRKRMHRENKELRREYAGLKARAEAAEKEAAGLKDELAGLQGTHRLDELERDNLGLKEKNAVLEQELQDRELKLEALKHKADSLSVELKRQKAMIRQFKEQSVEIMDQALPTDRCDETCPSYDLCQKRILIVGGITRMETLFRGLIEGRGGTFEHHDGTTKGGLKQLEARLKRADMVICPVSCNSHTACSAVKNLSKKHNKTFHMLENSSLNAVSEVIGSLKSAGQGS